MDTLEDLKQQIETQTIAMENQAQAFRTHMLGKLEEAKNNEILKAIQGINNRLTSIEARLPAEEED